MRKIYILLFCLFSLSLFSQNTIPEKFSGLEVLSTPYIDKTDMKFDNKIVLSEADWLTFQFQKLEEFDTEFEYYAYGKLNIAGYEVLLTERFSFEEKNHWAVFFKDGKSISHLNIAYQNSEGFLYIESEIKSDKILIKETSNLSNKEYSETYYSLKETGFKKCK